MTRPPKKSEFLEVRIPHPTKTAFMERCRADGRSASEAVRAFIEGELAPREPRRVPLKHLLAGALAGALAVAAAAPSVARQVRIAPASCAADAFDRLDTNRDGQLSRAEYAHRPAC